MGVERFSFTQEELQMFVARYAPWLLLSHLLVVKETVHVSEGMEMAQLICGGCRTLLMHARGATSVRCSCCHTVNLVPTAAPPPPPNNAAHVNCGNCHTMLMYPAGAPSVKCAICHFITNVNMGNSRIPIPMHRPSATSTPSTPTTQSQNQTVVVQNPMTVDESGKLVSNGITT